MDPPAGSIDPAMPLTEFHAMKHIRLGTTSGLLSGAMLAAMGFGSVGCSDNEFSSKDEPDFALEYPAGDEYTLDLCSAADRNTNVGQPIQIRNAGRAPLQIKRITLVGDLDGRLVLRNGESLGDCSSCEGADKICISSSSTCVPVTTEVQPFTLDAGLQHQLTMYVRAGGTTELRCPVAPAGIPDLYRDTYCGHLDIETNAPNTTGVVQNGKARVYLTREAGSTGVMRLAPEFLSFSDLRPGVAQSTNFSVTNEGTGDLTITQLTFDKAEVRSYFTITPQNLPAVIPPSQSQTWTLTMTPPADMDPATFRVAASLQVMAGTGRCGTRSIAVSAGNTVSATPRIRVEPTVLSFANGSEQPLTISNDGGTTLVLSQLKVEPSNMAQYYTFLVDGRELSANANEVVAKNASKTLTVRHIAPAQGSAVATLRIGHNDTAVDGRTEVILLGNLATAALGSVAPSSVTFTAIPGQTSARQVIIRNQGNAPLEVTNASFQASIGEATGFEVSGAIGTVNPGEFKIATVRFSGSAALAAPVVLVLETNSQSREDMSVLMSVLAPVDEPLPAPRIQPSFTTAARVGERTAFTVSDTVGAANLAQSSWFLARRPATSSAFYLTTEVSNATSASFTPDVPGDYQVMVVVYDGDGREVEATLDFQAQP